MISHKSSKIRRGRTRLRVTCLETRLAPAVLTVNTLSDSPVSGLTSTLNLREAIALIDTDGAATDAAGNSLAAAKASEINTSTAFGADNVIQFAPGLFSSAQQIVLNDGALVLDQNVSILGPSASWLAINGNNLSTVFDIASGTTVNISGLTIDGGAATNGSGGGIVNNGNLTLVGSTVSGNTAVYDGGILNTGELTLLDSSVSSNSVVAGNGGIGNDGGTLSVIDSSISGNSASGVGGLDNYNGGTATLVNATISGNSATYAGGIFNTASLSMTNSNVSDNTAVENAGIANTATLTMTDSVISGNVATQGNGGIGNYGGAMTLVNTVVSGNSAEGAGGIGNYDNGTMSLVNTTVSGNSAVFAGGIFNTANLSLNQSTVTGNIAGWGDGGGILNTANVMLTESTVAGNSDIDDGGIFNAGGEVKLIDSMISSKFPAGYNATITTFTPTVSTGNGNTTSTATASTALTSITTGSIVSSAGSDEDSNSPDDAGLVTANDIENENTNMVVVGGVKATLPAAVELADELTTPIDEYVTEAIPASNDVEFVAAESITLNGAMVADNVVSYGVETPITQDKLTGSDQETGQGIAVADFMIPVNVNGEGRVDKAETTRTQQPSPRTTWIASTLATIGVLWISGAGCRTGQESQPREIRRRGKEER
jgi:hypothetical protein